MTLHASSFSDTKYTGEGRGGAKEVQNRMLRAFTKDYVSALHATF